MTKQITAFFKWVFLSGNFRVYPVNFLKLQWLWFWKIVRWFCWIVNVGMNYIKNPNILTLLVVLLLVWFFGWFYACHWSFDCRSQEAKQNASLVVSSPTSGQKIGLGVVADALPNTPPEHAGTCVDGTLKCRIKAKTNTPKWRKRLAAIKWCLQAMFDASFSFSHFNSGVGLWGIVDGVVALGLFLFTWLIGGGALISSIITTMHENHHGAWRKWKCLLWNHTLIIGWDDNGPTVIREHLESRRIPLIRTPWGTWRPKQPERIVVITAGDAYEISKVVKLAIGNWVQRLRITFDVYQGTYDAVYERKRLAINRANAAYVLGDEGEPAHDARVSLWPTLASHFGSVLTVENNKEPLRCAINVEDYGLFCQRQRKGLQCLGHDKQAFFLDDATRPIDITTYNFYDSWAKRLLARLPLVQSRHGADSMSTSRVTIRDNKFEYAHVVIIGLSEMGRAILAELLRDCHYASDKNTRITIMDENVQERRLEFKSIYPRCEEVSDISMSWTDVSKLGAKDFVKEVGGFMGRENCQLTVIVAHDDPSVTTRIALPIMNKAFDLKTPIRILIRQGVKGMYSDRRITNITIGGASGMLTVFGMRDGAGFGMWKRDGVAKKMATSYGHWYALSTRRKQYCRQFIDALGQVLAGLGLVICDWLPSLSDKNYKSAFEDENFGTAEGLLDALLGISKGRDFLKAMHKHWCSCYLLSDDGNGIMETALDYRLVSFEELERDKSRKGLLALAKELFDLLTALRGCGLHVVDRKDSCHAK